MNIMYKYESIYLYKYMQVPSNSTCTSKLEVVESCEDLYEGSPDGKLCVLWLDSSTRRTRPWLCVPQRRAPTARRPTHGACLVVVCA